MFRRSSVHFFDVHAFHGGDKDVGGGRAVAVGKVGRRMDEARISGAETFDKGAGELVADVPPAVVTQGRIGLAHWLHSNRSCGLLACC